MSAFKWVRNSGNLINVSLPQAKSSKAIPAAYYSVIYYVGLISDKRNFSLGLCKYKFNWLGFFKNSSEKLINLAVEIMLFVSSLLSVSFRI
jgi:hypothetical protein